MGKQMIDMNQYKRKTHFDYFKSLANPYVGITENIDITAFLYKCKKEGYPFFLSFLYEVASVLNQIPEFRQRIEGDRIAEYDICDTSHTVAKEDGTFSYCRLQTHLPRKEFLNYARKSQEDAKKFGSIEEGENKSLVFISSVPWMRFTSIVLPTPIPADSNPRITWGKYTKQGERIWMPLSVLANHALVDGIHIGAFYMQLTKRMLEE